MPPDPLGQVTRQLISIASVQTVLLFAANPRIGSDYSDHLHTLWIHHHYCTILVGLEEDASAGLLWVSDVLDLLLDLDLD
jgi:hypothetical protein